MAGGEEAPVEQRTMLTMAAEIGLQGASTPCSTNTMAAEAVAAAGQPVDAPAKEGAGKRKAEAEGDRSQDKVMAVEDEEDDSTDGEDDDDDDDGAPTMTALEYIVKYKELPQCKVDLILRFETKRTPFSDTEEFKKLSADPAVTPAAIADAAAVHDARQERSVRFQQYVRSEYQAHGYVKLSDEYVARRIDIEAFSEKLWKEGFARSNDDERQ
ncbi:hypothetical protein ACP4OV_008881 [Aristida adscensionis]